MCLKKLNLSILNWVCHLVNHLKNISNRERDFNYDSKHSFYRFYKEYNEFEAMSLDSKYNKMKKNY